MDATAFLLAEAGTWDADVSVLVGPAPERSQGVMIAEVVGDRWLRTRFVNDTGYNGAGLYGVDEQKAVPVAVWVDTVTTFVTVGAGEYDEAAGTITYRFSAELPGRGLAEWREVHRRISNDEKRFDSFIKRGETELHMMSIGYRRQKT